MKHAVVAAYLSIAGTFLLANPAGGQTIEAARTAYAEGRFVEAGGLGEALETAEGYVLAANSLAIHGYYFAAEDEQPELFARAIRAADEAIRLDPDNPESHFQSAHAIGREAQTVGVVEALNRGYARRTREAAEEALRLDPEMAEAHLTLGSWHAEIVNKMGGLVARVTYRATRRNALDYYENALELAPDEIAVYLEYANGLMLLGRNRNREQARELLLRGIEISPSDAYDRILHDLTVERLATLDD